MGVNEHEQAARLAKARTIAEAVRERACHVDDEQVTACDLAAAAKGLQHGHDDFWEDIACVAGVRTPSAKTVAVVIEILEASASIERKMRSAPGMRYTDDDIFKGLT